MSLIKAKIKAFFHGMFHLHRICIHRQMTRFIWSIHCYDCGKGFYQDGYCNHAINFVLGETLKGKEDEAYEF